MNNPKLTDTQKLQRAGAVFVVMATMALAGSVLGPAGMIVSVFISNLLWPAVSKIVLDYYFGASAMLQNERVRYA